MKKWYAGRPRRSLERYKLFHSPAGMPIVDDNIHEVIAKVGDNGGAWEWLTLFEGAADGKQQQIDLLNWVIQLLSTGQTTGMIRKHVYNKLVEITGDGEKA